MSDLEVLNRRLGAREKALGPGGALLEQKSLELFEANQKLTDWNAALERRARELTATLERRAERAGRRARRGARVEPLEERVPRQHEPRAADADERRDRHVRAPARYRADRRAT